MCEWIGLLVVATQVSVLFLFALLVKMQILSSENCISEDYLIFSGMSYANICLFFYVRADNVKFGSETHILHPVESG